jgi:hypothetical protein
MFQLYVDRLGLRVHVNPSLFDASRSSALWDQAPELKLGLFRAGLDLDLIRYPSAAFGLNFDYNFSDVKFSSIDTTSNPIDNDLVPAKIDLEVEGAMTLGLHGRVIPIRIKDVPFELQGRVRSSFFKRADQARTLDWEVQGGLRPAIWDTSFLGHSTFSISLKAGYRSTYLEFHMQSSGETAELSAHWQGPFAEIQLIY